MLLLFGAVAQLTTIVSGNAVVTSGRTHHGMNDTHTLHAGDSVFIPAGTWHNICNTGNDELKLYTVYAMDADEDDEDEHDCGCRYDSGC